MNILDLYQAKAYQAKKVSSAKGGEYHGPCPGCGGEDRFLIWPVQGAGGSFWCRQCGKGGDAIQYLREFDGMGFRDACEFLGKETAFNSTTTMIRRKDWAPEPATVPPMTWQAKADKLVRWAHQHLLTAPDELRWLADRGIGLETVKRFRLGINPGQRGKDVWRSREDWGLPTELRDDNGKKRRLWLPRGLIIPKMEGVEVHRIRVRRSEGDPRYYVVPGSSGSPLYVGRDRPALVVVESELDAMALVEAAGDLVASYSIGNSSAKPDAASAEKLAAHSLILVSTDFDEPNDKGKRPGAIAARWWLEQYSTAVRWPVPAGKDPGDAFKAGVNLREWVKAGLSIGSQNL